MVQLQTNPTPTPNKYSLPTTKSFTPSKLTEQKRTFEEWLKIAADNVQYSNQKVNGTNTWEFQLIDYFADMTCLEGNDRDINFQKASFTLDGCVKIYNSRIDSVDLETRKLLSGLLDSSKGDKQTVEGEDGNEKTRQKEKRTKNVDTLVDNNSITCVELEQDFSQDPLFLKTAADFDLGGAQGLLLSHLDISNNGRIIFDGSDLNVEDVLECDGDLKLDLADLMSKFGSKLDLLHSQVICPTFQNFKFGGQQIEEYSVNNRQDFYHEPINFDDDMDDQEMGMGGNDDDNHSFSNDIGFREDFGEIVNAGAMVEVNTAERMMKIVDSNNITTDKTDKYSYFDRKQQWAGPQFWKSRVPPSSRPKPASTTRKKAKLDFSVKLSRKEVFARKGSTTFGKTGGFKKKEELLLPEDFGVKLEDFDRLFLKPKFRIEEYVQLVKNGVHDTNSGAANNFNNFGESFGSNEFGAGDNMGMDNDDQDSVDNADRPGFEFDDSADIQYPTTLQLEQPDSMSAGYKFKPKPLVFAKSAKRVDVQRLKSNLWSKINSTAFPSTTDENQSPNNSAIDTNKKDTESHIETKFSSIVGELSDCYEQKAYKDISVAFCFICILHLANENNLGIVEDAKDLKIVR